MIRKLLRSFVDIAANPAARDVAVNFVHKYYPERPEKKWILCGIHWGSCLCSFIKGSLYVKEGGSRRYVCEETLSRAEAIQRGIVSGNQIVRTSVIW